MNDRKERTDLPNILKVLYCVAKIKDQIAFNVRQIFLELAGSAVQGFMFILGYVHIAPPEKLNKDFTGLAK